MCRRAGNRRPRAVAGGAPSKHAAPPGCFAAALFAKRSARAGCLTPRNAELQTAVPASGPDRRRRRERQRSNPLLPITTTMPGSNNCVEHAGVSLASARTNCEGSSVAPGPYPSSFHRP
jgi:hypothetical protein